MAISKETRSYIDGLVKYYVSEASSYRQIAESCNADGSVSDTAIGMIVGCIYSAFLQSCREQGTSPKLDEINDVILIIHAKIPEIRKAVSQGARA